MWNAETLRNIQSIPKIIAIFFLIISFLLMIYTWLLLQNLSSGDFLIMTFKLFSALLIAILIFVIAALLLALLLILKASP